MTRAARLVVLAAWVSARGAAQAPTVRWSAQAIPTLTATALVPGGATLTEGRIVHPVLMLHADAWSGAVRGIATLNFEKWTIPNAELAPGVWGEGFADRRHPHTVFHELMLVAPEVSRLFLAAGKGFVPFGTEDPMSRPVLRYPVNHHLSQILERAVAMIGVRAGPAMLEASLFNGDEPVSPTSWPAMDRFGDSWSARFTLRPRDPLELQASYAFVHSPENRAGAGPDDVKWSASARWERSPVYALVEWARTSVSDGFFVFRSVLAEGALSRGRHRPYARFEVTERPEDERVFNDLFRTVRPVFENSLLGVTRWTILTAGDQFDLKTIGPLHLAPVAEVSYAWIAKVGGGIFEPAAFYGRDRGFAITLGARLSGGMRMPRMGQYSAPREGPAGGMHHGD